jgi:hypothetical protein
VASANDVPSRYDLVVTAGGATEGFVCRRNDTGRALVAYTPRLIPRTSVQGPYGDGNQEAFLALSQKDFSLGEQQRYFRVGDEESVRRYWVGTNINVSEAGAARLRNAVGTTAATGTGYLAAGIAPWLSSGWFALSTSNLYGIANDGTVTDHGAHGLGAAPRYAAVAHDYENLYFSTTAAGTVGVRRWDGSAFSTFSATGADSLEFLNNALYGIRGVAGSGFAQLVRYDSAGASTTLFNWQTAQGNPQEIGVHHLEAFGGDLLILRPDALWLYDGTAPAKVYDLPPDFAAHDIAIMNGSAFIAGAARQIRGGTIYTRPTILYYSNGTTGKLWEAREYQSGLGQTAVGSAEGGLFFTDDVDDKIMFYNPATGGISSLGSFTQNGAVVKRIAAGYFGALVVNQSDTATYYPGSAKPSSGTLTTSLFDFDLSLTKVFRGITVEWEDDSTDTGATVDIAYRVGDLEGAYTNLQTTAVSGTEYLLSNVTGRAISVKVTLNKSGSTHGPTIKRISVRAIPVQPSHGIYTFLLDCTGAQGKPDSNVWLNDQTRHPLDGKEQVDHLRTAITSSSPITWADEFGTHTGMAVAEQCEITRHGSAENQEYIAKLVLREV